MSFAPRPVNNSHHQRNSFGSNSPNPSRFRGQARTNSNSRSFSNNSYVKSYVKNIGSNNLDNNLGQSNVADFTARRQQQLSSPQTSQFTNFPRSPLDFSPVSKTAPTSPAPNFVTPNPWWLRSLSFLKYGSGLLTGGLIFAAITVYSGNVSSQREWSENYRQLESLRRTERQLLVANEVIKNKAAEESSTTKQLVRLDPSQRLYLPAPSPAPESSPQAKGTDVKFTPNKAAPKAQPADKNSPNQPLGY